MKTKELTLPKWFTGTIYEEGLVVENPFSKEEYELNSIELSMYDFLLGCDYLMQTAPKTLSSKNIEEYKKGLMWFRKNNPNAYMALLD